jgi:hypothetical protein
MKIINPFLDIFTHSFNTLYFIRFSLIILLILAIIGLLLGISRILLDNRYILKRNKSSSLVDLLFIKVTETKYAVSIYKNMMATGTKLVTKEIFDFKRIFYVHNAALRKGPMTSESIMNLITQIVPINVKLCQHLATIAYPKFSYPIDKVQRLYPHIKITSFNDALGWDDLIAAAIGNHIAKKPFFQQGKLELCGTPPYNPNKPFVHDPKSEAYIQTGQLHPDYLYIFKEGKYYRYYDLKAGQVHYNQGHIFVTSDMDKYEEISKKFFRTQADLFKEKAITDKSFALFYEKINKLAKDSTLSWIEKNQQLHEYYEKNLHLLPPNINPSLVFHVNPDYEVSEKNLTCGVTNRIPASSSSCVNMSNTEQTVVANLLSAGKMVTKNYYNSPDASASIRNRIKTQLLEEAFDWFTN